MPTAISLHRLTGVFCFCLANNRIVLEQKYSFISNTKIVGRGGVSRREEVFLDIFIQLASSNAKKLVARTKHTEINIKKEVSLEAKGQRITRECHCQGQPR